MQLQITSVMLYISKIINMNRTSCKAARRLSGISVIGLPPELTSAALFSSKCKTVIAPLFIQAQAEAEEVTVRSVQVQPNYKFILEQSHLLALQMHPQGPLAVATVQ
jgi:hypothetical protein